MRNCALRDIAIGIALLAASAGMAAAQGASAPEDAEAIVRKSDAAMAFGECEMRVAFEDAKASGQARSLKADIWYAKDSGTMIAFTAPAREKGKRLLMIGDSMWMSAPGVSRPLRLSGKDAFMGTSFTNDDIMNFDKSDDYSARILASEADSWTIELVAKKRSLPYQRVVMAVGRDYLPRRQELYLLSGELAKTIVMSEPRSFGGLRRPARMRVEDAMAKGASTTVVFEEIAERPVDRSRLSPERFAK